MSRRSTRSFTRRLSTTEEKLSTSRTRRQATKPVIILSSDSEEDCYITPTVLTTNQRRKTSKKQLVDSSDSEETLPKEKPRISTAELNHEEVFRNIPTVRTPRKEKSRTSLLDLSQVSPVTPPKQKKPNHEVLRTPQHKKINDENLPQTPSSLFVNLALTSPNHNSNNTKVEESKNRTKLFKENNAQAPNVLQNARKALHSTFPTEMPGREAELDELRGFIKGHLKGRTSGSLYVSGPPGTGKTASLNVILQENGIVSEFKEVYVNCTAIKSSSSIYSRIAKELGVPISGKTEKDYLFGVENYLKKKHKMILLVLDEIDQLENKNQSILYTIFEWPSRPNSQLILIGIANALDLTDRTLPRLQSRCELKPKLMHFAPYTKQQIVGIFTSRLKAAGVLDVFSEVALQMLAGKVAAISGDVRRALDIGRRVVELVDKNKREKIMKPIENLAIELVDKVVAEKEPVEMQPKTVDLKQVVDVLNNVYGTSQNLTDEAEDSFPLQQKIIVCTHLLMLKKAKNKDVTVGRLHDVYRRVCAKRNLLAVDQAEFVGLCALIETKGIIKVVGKKEGRLRKVNLEWDEEEVAAALKDKQLLSMILQDETCLGKF